ncbi:MAG TPA: symporter [Cytophagales bacterium]|nr:symporter [Cytophagales bacterium]HAA23958.1 symporter [Cytophagales bacterium]
MQTEIDNIALNFNEASLTTLNIALAFIMFGIALDLTPNDFRRLVQSPKSTLVGLLSQFLILPALTFLLILIFRPAPSMAMGMILVAACPGGNVSNFISTIAKGNIALSVTLTGLASTLAIFFTPLNFALWAKALPDSSSLQQEFSINPGEVVFTILTLLAVPLVIGMYTNHKFPEFVKKIKRPVRNMSVMFFAGFVVVAFTNNVEYFLEHIHLIAFLVFVHNAVALSSGYGIASLFRLDGPTRRSISIETGIQNSGLALVIIFNFFDGIGGMAIIAAWWGIWHLISGSVIGYFWSRRATPEPA